MILNQYAFIGAGPTENVIFGDNFNDNSIDAAKWIVGGSAGFTVAETGGQMEITGAGGVDSGAKYLESLNAYNMSDDRRWRVKGVTLPQAVSGATSYLIAIDNGGKYFGFVKNFTTLNFEYNNGSPSFTNTGYNAINHLWLQLRHDAGADEMIWETSPDKIVWTPQRTVTSWAAKGFNMAALKWRCQLNFSDSVDRTQITDDVSLYEPI